MGRSIAVEVHMSYLVRRNSIGNLALEVLIGCDFNCTGCSVNTSGVVPFNDEDLKSLSNIVQEVRDNDWEMSWMEIAPTDIMSAVNRKEVLENPTIREMVSGFKSIVFNSSFLSPKPESYVELAKDLEAFMPGLNAEFLVPVELKHYRNVGYFEKLRNHIAWLEEHLETVSIGSVTAIVNMTEEMIDKGVASHQVLHETRHIKLHEHNDTTTFVFHYGRRDLREKENRAEFLRTIKKQNDLFAKHFNQGYEFKIDEQGIIVGADYHLAYRNGELYMAPFINSPIALFHDDFKFDKPWSLQSIVDRDVETYLDSLGKAMSSPDCQGCKWIKKCAMRGVHRMMDLLETDECLSVLSQIDLMNKE